MNILKKEKKIIYRDEEQINQTNKQLIDTIATINRYTDSLNNLEIVLTIEDVKSMTENMRDCTFIKRVFYDELKRVCK